MPTFSFCGSFIFFHELTFLPILENNDVLLFSTQKTSFMLFLNKFDIFEKKILKVRTIWILYIVAGEVIIISVSNVLHSAGAT